MSFKIPCGGFKLDENSFSLDENGVLSVSGGGGSSSGQFIVTVYATNAQGTKFAADKTYDEIKAAIDSGAMVLVHYKDSKTSPNYLVYYNITVGNGIYSFLRVEPMEDSYVYFYVIRIGELDGEMAILENKYKAQLANQT